MIRTTAPLALLLLAQCAPADPPGRETATAARGVGEPRTCISLDAVSGRRAIDAQTIRFEMLGGEVLHNRLPGRCPGLDRSADGFETLAFEVHGSQLCRGDRVRVLDPAGGDAATAYRLSIPCPLGAFVPVTEDAADE